MNSTSVILAVATLASWREEPPRSAPASKEVRSAVESSLTFLKEEGVGWIEGRKCTTCHHVPMMLWTHGEARRRGFTVDEEAVGKARRWELGRYLAHREFAPTGQDRSDPKRGPAPGAVYLAVGVAADERADASTAKLFDYLLGMQEADGSWATKRITPPLTDGDDVATMLVLLATGARDAKDAPESRRRALEWLDKSPPRDETQPLALRVAVAARFGDFGKARESLDRLKGRQRDDGGWSQVEGRPSDALATGQALYALASAGEPLDGPAIRRARLFLLESQQDDGSWSVKTRSPKGEDEIISYYGTGWATLGLIRSLPERTTLK